MRIFIIHALNCARSIQFSFDFAFTEGKERADMGLREV